MTRQRLCDAAAIAEGGGRGFRIGEGKAQRGVFVVRRNGTLLAYVNSCPHVGTPLDWVPHRFFNRSGDLLLCATHGALFAPETGLCVRGPCTGASLTPAPIAVEDDAVYLLDLPG